MLEIKHKTLVDFDQLAGLFESVGFNRLGERSRDAIPSLLKNTDHYIACYVDGELSGFIRLLTDYYSIGYIFDLCVAPEHRKKGIGKRLMQEMITFCDSRDISVTHLLDTSQYENYYSQYGFNSEQGIKGMYRINPSYLKEKNERHEKSLIA